MDQTPILAVRNFLSPTIFESTPEKIDEGRPFGVTFGRSTDLMRSVLCVSVSPRLSTYLVELSVRFVLGPVYVLSVCTDRTLTRRLTLDLPYTQPLDKHSSITGMCIPKLKQTNKWKVKINK